MLPDHLGHRQVNKADAILMKTLRTALATLAFATGALTASAQLETAFTYQGRLVNTNGPLDGHYNFIFSLFDDAGAQVGENITNLSVTVAEGNFGVTLDFGPNSFRRVLVPPRDFVGPGEWLEISVRTNRAKTYQTLAPRQRLTPAPYAATVTGTLPSSAIEGNYTEKVTFGNSSNVFLGNYYGDGANLTNLNFSNLWKLSGNEGTTPGKYFLGTTDEQPLEVKVHGMRALRLEENGDGIDNGTIPDGAPNMIGGSPQNYAGAGVVGATIAGGGATNHAGYPKPNVVLGDYGVVGGGLSNRIERSVVATIGGGEGNAIGYLSSCGTIGGGHRNLIGTNSYDATIAGGRGNRTDARVSFIGGGYANTIGIESVYTTIGGGDANAIGTNSGGSVIGGGMGNRAEDNTGRVTIAGGEGNRIDSENQTATVGGGYENHIGRHSSHGVIAGGYSNEIGAESPRATIAGGIRNSIGTNSSDSVIGGGADNTIPPNSELAVIPGGSANYATDAAFAAGVRAKAYHRGAFVWGDYQNVDLASTNANSVTMRAAGGYRLFSNAGSTAGVHLSPGGGSWTSMSDRNAKENLVPVDPQAVLDQVVALPLATWNYKSQDAAIRHLGPMAQDFKAAFGVGESDTGITGVDADGVALAAIQGLNQKVESENAILRAENAELRARLERLERLEQLGRQFTK